MSLALSLCQYVLRPRRGLGQASPSLEAPRLQALDSFINILEGKDCHHEDKQGKEASFGFVFSTWNWYDFWSRSWGLPCLRPLLPTRCWFVWRWCVSRSWRRCLGGLKTGPPRRHRIQPVEGPVLDPRAKETCLKKGSESGPPWNQKWSPLEGPVLVPSLWQICWNVSFKLKLISLATAAAGILNWGGPFLRAFFLLRFEDQKRAPSLSY